MGLLWWEYNLVGGEICSILSDFQGHNLHYEKFADGSLKCIEDEIPFELPEGWEWARLGILAQYKKGPFGSSITKAMFVPDSPDAVKVYEQKNAINKDATLGSYFISTEKYESLKSFEVFPNDIIVSCAGTIGETFVLPIGMRKGIINQALMKISLFDLETMDFYLMYFDFKLKSAAQEQGHGIALKNIPPFDVLKKYLVPIPPIQEQHRIVVAVNNMISKVDFINADSAAIQDLISQAKSKILDLAIRGKLVPQDPNDEPASVLLERIRAEKEELIKQGKIKRDKKESVIFKGDDNSYYVRQNSHVELMNEQFIFELPHNWEWCTLLNLAEIDLGKTLDGAKNTGINHPYLRSANVRWNNVDLSDLKEMLFEPDEIERYSIRFNDLLICEGGDVGRSCVWTNYYEIQYQNALHRVRFFDKCNPFFFMYYMMYYENKGILKSLCKGVTIKHLTGNVLSLIPFALPPIEEQTRIVQKLDRIFLLLDNMIND